jgi:hypothetical protein
VERTRAHRDRFVPTGQDGASAQGRANTVERLAQRIPRTPGVRLGPEDGNERIAAMKSTRVREHEVSEQGKSLRLLDSRSDSARFAVTLESARAEGTELEHLHEPPVLLSGK